MRDWSAFVHEGHLAALEDHLESQGFIDSLELQRLFAAMRANDLIWSSVVNHYLLDRPAPPSDLLYWFEDGARIPAAFLKSYNRDLLLNNKLKEPAGFEVGGVPIDLAAIKTPMLVIALKDDHVSAWEAVYRGARDIGADFILGGSGHNAGVINPPAANKHGFWTNDEQPADANDWLATRHPPRRQLVADLDRVADRPRLEEVGPRPRHHGRDRARPRPLRDDEMNLMTDLRPTC